VLAVNAATGYAVAVAAGRVGVIASINNMKVVAFLTVLGPESVGQSDVLVIESFSMLEFQYPSALDRWFYAPQMRAHAAPGRRVSVLVMRFTIPGLDNAPAFGCGANLMENPRDLFGEVYGDWLLTIDETGRRATGDVATVTITYVDDTGMAGTRVVAGPVVPGTLPATYTGGGNGGACFHGYGSTG
jgi:ribosomal protein S28E/S33